MNRLFVLLLCVPSIFFVTCTSNEIGSSKDVDPESIYFDYKIWGEEGNDSLTIKLQYRFAGENGTTLLLDEPSKVELDGEVLKADSSKITGVFYEVQKPLATFTGKHTITFTSGNKKQYKEVFNFEPISLANPVPATIQRGNLVFAPMVIGVNGLSNDDKVRVLMTDTSYLSEEINRVDTVKNGRLIISKEELTALSNGPVHLEITKEYEKAIKNGTPEGGRISISYGLKREFILKD
jgi:hypothetical protein